MHYGLTRKQAMQLAFEYATVNSKKFPESWAKNNAAGKDWFRGFLSRDYVDFETILQKKIYVNYFFDSSIKN